MPGSFAGDEELGDGTGGTGVSTVVWAKEFNRQKSIKIKAVMIFIIQVQGYCSTAAQFLGYKMYLISES